MARCGPFHNVLLLVQREACKRDEHGVPKLNTPLGWPKKGGEEEVNKFLEPGVFKISGDKLQAISRVSGVVPGGVLILPPQAQTAQEGRGVAHTLLCLE